MTARGSTVAQGSPSVPDTLTAWRILLVECDEHDRDVLAGSLGRHGHDVLGVDSGRRALAEYGNVDLVLLDFELPDLDGLEVCQAIRKACDVPIIAVTARSTELDCVLGLQAGADDYVLKPYRLRELMARMDAVMRRAKPQQATSPTIEHGRLRIDANSREVSVGDRRIELTRKEFDLLHLLASHPDAVISREDIMHRIWGDSWSRRTVDTHVGSLRNKLGESDWIVTVRGVGFRLGAGGSG